MAKDDRKRLNLIYVKSTTLAWLLNGSNRNGDNFAIFTGTVLDKVADDQMKYSEDESIRTARNLRVLRARIQLYQDALEAATLYRRLPTQENADLLEQICEDAKADYDDIMAEVDNDPFSTLIHDVRKGGTKFRECMEWLTGQLASHEGTLPSRAIIDVGLKQGYSENMLNRVKRTINEDGSTPTIKSIKEPTGWWWKVISEEQLELPIQ